MLNLSSQIKKVKDKIKPYENEIFIVLTFILTAFICFGLGKLSFINSQKPAITIENKAQTNVDDISSQAIQKNVNSSDKIIMASKNGMKYYYPWCSGASRIKEENKVWFSSVEEAEKAGLQPAANCKGL